MDVYSLKQTIRDSEKVEYILEDLGMGNVHKKEGYWSCSQPDGDNPTSTIIYDNEMLTTIAYTRNINENKDALSDIFTLIQFIKKISFFKALNYVCELIGVDYYDEENIEVPLSLQFLSELDDMNNENNKEEKFKTRVRPISLLSYYSNVCNILFYNDNISYQTQKEFNIGYDEQSNRISIPIFNELSQLVGVKGRLFVINDMDTPLKRNGEPFDKYVYLERCNKSHILYGLYKTYDSIIEQGIVYVGEGEKFVMQLWSAGICNSVALGGHSISKFQLILLQRLGVEICLCFDKDIEVDDIKYECSKMEEWITISYLHDVDNILKEKESPSDNIDNFNKLVSNYKYEYYREDK